MQPNDDIEIKAADERKEVDTTGVDQVASHEEEEGPTGREKDADAPSPPPTSSQDGCRPPTIVLSPRGACWCRPIRLLKPLWRARWKPFPSPGHEHQPAPRHASFPKPFSSCRRVWWSLSLIIPTSSSSRLPSANDTDDCIVESRASGETLQDQQSEE